MYSQLIPVSNKSIIRNRRIPKRHHPQCLSRNQYAFTGHVFTRDHDLTRPEQPKPNRPTLDSLDSSQCPSTWGGAFASLAWVCSIGRAASQVFKGRSRLRHEPGFYACSCLPSQMCRLCALRLLLASLIPDACFRSVGKQVSQFVPRCRHCVSPRWLHSVRTGRTYLAPAASDRGSARASCVCKWLS